MRQGFFALLSRSAFSSAEPARSRGESRSAAFLRNAALALILLHSPARAAFQETGLDARSAGMGDAMTADPEGLAAAPLNPAALGQIRGARVLTGIRRLFHQSGGSADLSGMVLGAAAPVSPGESRGAFGVYWTHDRNEPAALDRVLGLTYASRSWRELGAGTLDVGATLKVLSRSGRAFGGDVSKAAADLGAYYRWSDDQALGLSLLNVNGPDLSLGPLSDRAPTVVRLGYTRRVRRLAVGMDVSKREPSAETRSAESAAVGVEHSWSTARHGSWSARSGLILNDGGRSWSLGGGWSRMGTSLDYAVRLPLSGERRVGHVISLAYRFGEWEPEGEYERLLEREARHRDDLSRALDRAQLRQDELRQEIMDLQAGMESLRGELAAREAEIAPTEEKLRRTQDALRLKELEERRRGAAQRLKALQEEQDRLRRMDQQGMFAEEWAAYQKLKSEGVADVVLTERAQRILRRFQGKGADVSEAHRELRRLLSR